MTNEPNVFDPTGPDDLPDTLPIFPLSGVLLLPGGRLPLNIFEPRYLNMVLAALAGSRMIGMVQPVPDDTPEAAAFAQQALGESRGSGDPSQDAGSAPAFRVGCAGRIVSFSETDDGRFLITLRGVARFRIREELAPWHDFRRVRPDYTPYHGDLTPTAPAYDRERLLDALTAYFDQQGIEADWDTIKSAQDAHLVTSLAMVCPFSPTEKQTLLEAPDVSARAHAMTSMLEMAILGRDGPHVVSSRH